MAMAACNTRKRLSEVNRDGNGKMEKLSFKIHCFFDEQELIDVTFKLSNPTALVTAHRLILAAASPYFRELFKSDKGICPLIEITDIDSDTFEHLITFCYTDESTFITIDNVERILKAALILQLEDAVANCADFVKKHITDYTLERAYALESEIQCPILNQKVFEYETESFMSLIQSTDFLTFGANKLQKILECNYLNVQSEQDVFEAVKRWYEHDALVRKQQLPDLIACLRLTQFDTNFLLAEVQTLPGCEVIALTAISWINYPSVRSKLTLKYTDQRGMQTGELFFALNIRENMDLTLFSYNNTEDSWQKEYDIKISYSDFRLISMDDNLIFIGGSRNDKAINEVVSWNLKTKSFKHLRPMNQPRRSHSVVILNNTIYAIGGIEAKDEYLKSVEKYSVASGWKSINSMIKPRAEASAVAFNGKIYVMGGCDGNPLAFVDCYDPATDRWMRCANMNEARHCCSATVHNGQIFVVGGCYYRSGPFGKITDYTQAVERYDPQKNEWTKICSLPYACKEIGCISIDNQLWAVGGVPSDRVSVYDEENNKWIVKSPICLPGCYYCFAVPKVVFQSE